RLPSVGFPITLKCVETPPGAYGGRGHRMRWVWRAEAGGFKVEYAAVVLLVATLVTAVFAFGLPTDVRVLYAEGICRIMPDSQGCDGEGQGSDQDTGGSGQDGTPGEEDGEGQAEP